MATQLDSRQIKKRLALAKLAATAGVTLESILDKLNIEVDSPLRIAATFPTADAVLNFSSSLVASADGANKAVSPVKKQIFSGLNSPTINFQTQALSNAADFDITWGTATLSQFRFAAFTLIGSGKIKVLFSAEFGSEAALIAAVNPGTLFVSGGLPIGYVTLQATNASPAAYKTSGSVTDIIENAKIYRFGAGSGGGSSSSGTGTGAEVIDLRYRAEIQDSFQDIPGIETPTDIDANKTDPSLHDVANELFRFSYDASQTVTGTGTSMSLSAAPTFTVKLGDVLVVGDEVREITALGSINSTGAGFTIASAFNVDPSSAAANVSQAIYTKDLNAFDANGTGLAVSSQITDSVSSVLVNYEDSLTLADVIPDWGAGPHVAYHVTADNITWGDKLSRETSLSGQALATNTPTSDTQFRIRFFANKTSGSGQVNLLSYKAFWHEQLSEPFGATYNTAFANLADSDFVNVTHTVVSGKSRFTFPFTYGRGLNAGNPAGSALEVFANGQQVPRFETGITSVSQASFNEISDNIIEMDTDYSASGLEFIFKVPVTVVDSNTSNTNRIANLELMPGINHTINGNFDFWQRGTSLGSGTGSRYLADRWVSNSVGTTYSVSRQTSVFTEPFQSKYFHREAVASVANAANYSILYTRLEDITKYSGVTKTLSFWAKADANKPMSVEFSQFFGTGGSPSASVLGLGVTKVNLTTSWQKFTVTVTLPSIAGKTLGTNGNDCLDVFFWFDAGSNFNARTDTLGQQSGTFDIAQVKFEDGNVASPFRLSGDTLAGELVNCQRFYETNILNPILLTAVKQNLATNWQSNDIPFKVVKRANPSIAYTASSIIRISGTPGTNNPGTTIITPGFSVGLSSFNIVDSGTSGTSNLLSYQIGNWVADAEL